jgi:hypothetical protein
VSLAIIKGAVGKNRSETFLTSLENRVHITDVQVCFVLACKTGVGQVFRCCA